MSDTEQLESLPSSSLQDTTSLETPPPARRKLASYDTKFKLSVIAYAENHSNRKAGKKLGVGERSVRDWRKRTEKLDKVSVKTQ